MSSILYVIGSLAVGGTERHLLAIARALRQRGWNVVVFSLAGEGPLLEEFLAAGVEVIVGRSKSKHRGTLSRLGGLRQAVLVLFRNIRRRRPDIVHCFLPEAYLVGAPLAWMAGVTVRIVSRRSLNRYQAKHGLLGWIERHLHHSMTAVLGNSRRVVEELAGEGVPADRLALIYNGIDRSLNLPRSTRLATRQKLGVGSDELVLSIVANLIPYKGHLDLVAALTISKSQMPARWRLLIIGRDDGVGPEVVARSRAAGLDGHISLLGSRNDVPDLLDASDIGILCSHEEGFSNAVLEGMAAGLPMVVTDVGGNAEAIQDGGCGLVVPAQDAQRLGEAIVRANDGAVTADAGAAKDHAPLHA